MKSNFTESDWQNFENFTCCRIWLDIRGVRGGGEQRGRGGEQHQDRLQVGLNITLVAFIITITLITLVTL